MYFSLGLHLYNLLTWELAIPQERLEMKEEFLSRLVKLTSLENGRSYILSKKDHGGDRKSDGYIIESTDQSDHLADSKTEDKNISWQNARTVDRISSAKKITEEIGRVMDIL